MSRILKRPMFRRGGEVMEGVMTGIQPRGNYATGNFLSEKDIAMNTEMGGGPNRGLMELMKKPAPTPAPSINNFDISKYSGANFDEKFDTAMKTAEYIMGRDKGGIGSDAVAQALISGGLRAIGGAGAGKGVLGELATAFSPVVDRAFEQLQKRKDTKMGLAVELFKNMSDDDKIALYKKAKIYADTHEGVSLQDALKLFSEAELKEASPFLKEATVYTDANTLLKQWSTEPVERILDLDPSEQKNVALFEVKDFRTRAKGGEIENIPLIYPSTKNLVEVPGEEGVLEYLPKTSKGGKTEEIPFQVGQQYFIPGIGPRGSIAVYNPDRKFRIIKQVQ